MRNVIKILQWGQPTSKYYYDTNINNTTEDAYSYLDEEEESPHSMQHIEEPIFPPIEIPPADDYKTPIFSLSTSTSSNYPHYDSK